MYEVRIDLPKERVILTFTKDYSHSREDVHREFNSACLKVKAKHGFFDVLVGMIDIHTVAQDRVDSSQTLMKWVVDNGLRRCAMSTGTLVQELQFKRISARNEKFSYFRDFHEAASWLDAQRLQDKAA